MVRLNRPWMGSFGDGACSGVADITATDASLSLKDAVGIETTLVCAVCG